MKRQPIVSSPFDLVQAPSGGARLGPRRAVTLAVEEVHPFIRIAHRQASKLQIPSRILFDHEFVLILRGGGVLRMGDEELAIRPHRLFFIRPYVPHEFRGDPATEGEHVAVHFDFKPGFPPFADAPGRRRPYEVRLSRGLALPPCVDLSPRHPVAQCLESVVEARNAGGPTAGIEETSQLLRAILGLIRSASPARSGATGDERNRVRMERVTDYVHQRFDQELSVSELAEVAGLSPAHLARLFSQWTGKTPADYVRGVKIDEARRLLANVDLSIKEVARATGFKNQYHFSRVFRQIDGLTPTLYREAKIAGRRS